MVVLLDIFFPEIKHAFQNWEHEYLHVFFFIEIPSIIH